MQVSVETLNGLERKVTVSVPSEKIEKEVQLRLRNLIPKLKIHGFRAGKIPLNVVKQRYSDSVRQDVAREMVQPTLFEALKAEKLTPAGEPMIEPLQVETGKDFKYTASFEIYPEVLANEIDLDQEIEIVHAAVTDADLTVMLDNLRAQNKTWHDVSRPVAAGDKTVIDFKGFLGGQAFEGGSADGYEMVIGEGSMIPGFEDGLIGAVKDTQTEIKMNFPDDYGHKELAGKAVIFNVTVVKVMEGILPDLDLAFAEKFNIKEGGVDAFKKDIKENMVRELERRVSSMNRGVIFEKLLEKNKFDLPTVLLDREIEHLKHEMYHQVFGHNHADDEQIPDFPRILFEEKARYRVHLGLLFSEYVKKHAIIADAARVDAMIEKLAGAYEVPDELRNWYQDSSERRADIEALIMEEMVADKIIERAKTIAKKMTYDQVVNPEKNKKEKGV